MPQPGMPQPRMPQPRVTRRLPALATLTLACTALLALVLPAQAEQAPYAEGRSSVQIEGLAVELNVPVGLSKEKPASLVIVLHGSGGSAVGMAGSMNAWGALGYVVCAPKSKGQVWTASDLATVLRIAAHLKKVLPIDPTRVHVVGFSNGGWNLGPLAFADELRPCSATWIASGCSAQKVPKWALTGLGVLAMAGTKDANASSAAGTPRALKGQVRSATVRFQPGLDHKWPHKLMPFFQWWMGAMEGRFVPGEDMSFAWGKNLKRALASVAGQRHGGVFVYAYDASDIDDPLAKRLQTRCLLDSLVQHYGEQLVAVKLDFAKCKAELEALGVTSTPAIVVLKPGGKVKKVLLEKNLKARKIAVAFKSVAPNKKKPGK